MDSGNGRRRPITEELTAALRPSKVTKDEWRAEAEKSLKGRSLEGLTTRSHEAVPIAPLYTQDQSTPNAGVPGLPPFLRGRGLLGSGPRGWTNCPRVLQPDPQAAGEEIREALAQGADGLWLSIDRGASPGDQDCASLNPQHGVVLAGATDLELLLGAAAQPGVPLHLDAGSAVFATAALLRAACGEAEISLDGLRGSLGCDPLASLVTEGELAGGMDRHLQQMAELCRWTRHEAPALVPITISSLPYHDAGANGIQELAFTLATAVHYLRSLEAAGIEPAVAADSMRVVVAVGREFFTEIAKLRALRGLWWSVMQACGVPETSGGLRLHAVSSARCLTERDPWVNLLRVTVQACAASVAGVQCLTTHPFDAALGSPDQQARRLALNTQTILREESHFNRVVDPAGGSYYVEQLGDQLARAAWAELQSIEAAGGMAACIQSSEVQRRVAEARKARGESVATRKDAITGVSSFANLDEERLQRQGIDLKSARDRTEVPARRENVQAILKLLRSFAASPGEGSATTELAATAAGAGVSLRELKEALAADALSTRADRLHLARDAAPFERLRGAAERWADRQKHRPRAFLATLGPAAVHLPRADFARNMLAAAGIEAVLPGALDSPASAAAAWTDSEARVAVICSSDALYEEHAATVAQALKEAGAGTVLLAGKPGANEEQWRAAGVDAYIHLGCNVLKILDQLLEAMEVHHD